MTTPDPTLPPEEPDNSAAPLPGWPEQPDAVLLHAEDFSRSQEDLYRRLRRDHGPVVPVLLDGQIPVWMVLGYRELVRVTTDPTSSPATRAAGTPGTRSRRTGS
ncbi:hypothetical protein SAZ11_27940 [Streptomyces sp. FXJ1.4098]|nr:hypothetical protein [Streptomyces sp. FXJ1.4098]